MDEKKFNNDLFNTSKNTYEICNKDKNKFMLLLRKGIYPYEYMNSWERYNETELPTKDKFYSNLALEDIIDNDYRHACKVFKRLKPNTLGDYHDLYVQSDTLLIADVFENFRNKCIEIYGLDDCMFLSCHVSVSE